jgi:hypothetical protein
MRKRFLFTIFALLLGLSMSNAASARGLDGHASMRGGEAGVRGGRSVPRGYGGREFGAWGFYDPFWYGGLWMYPMYPNAYYAGGYGASAGGVRLEVKPKTAQVYVDGGYAGVVDDFDGFFQHLDLAPGGHRIEMRAPGYQTLVATVYVQPGQTLDWYGTMVPEHTNN